MADIAKAPLVINTEPATVGIDTIKPHPANPRQGDVGAIYESIDENDFYSRIVVQKSTGHILAGNHRWKAAKEHGMPEVPVDFVDVDDVRALKILLADNRTNDKADYDKNMLAQILVSVTDMEGGLSGTGYDGDDLDDLIRETGMMDEPPEAPEAPIDKAEELREKWGVERDQIWQVGRHRVMCGDSTSEKDKKALFDGVQFDLLFTSPPYAQQREYGNESDVSDWDALMQGVFSDLSYVSNAQVLVNLGLVHKSNEWIPYWDNWIGWMRSSGWRRFGFYVWDQGSGLPGNWNGRLGPSHEFIFHFNKESKQPLKWVEKNPKNIKVRAGGALRESDGSVREIDSPLAYLNTHKIHDSVIRVTRNARRNLDSLHPATFPYELPENIINSYCDPGDVVYDPFWGSGTTAIGAERINRVCYGMEIQPEYVSVGLERLSMMGLAPELING